MAYDCDTQVENHCSNQSYVALFQVLAKVFLILTLNYENLWL